MHARRLHLCLGSQDVVRLRSVQRGAAHDLRGRAASRGGVEARLAGRLLLPAQRERRPPLGQLRLEARRPRLELLRQRREVLEARVGALLRQRRRSGGRQRARVSGPKLRQHRTSVLQPAVAGT